MPIPDFQSIMLPLLQLFSDGREWSHAEATTAIADHFNMTADDRQQMLRSRSQTVIGNRVSWAKVYLKQAGLVCCPRRGNYAITQRGRDVLQQHLDRINITFLMQFDEFRQFRNRSGKNSVEPHELVQSASQQCAESTPQETIEKGYETLNNLLAAEILNQVMGCSAQFFENLVIDLLLAMGYGGSRAEAGQVVGRSGDGGIDGIIKEDRLGLDVIYVQAKRWSNSVGSPEIQKFAGALLGRSAKKGIFITTSTFTNDAQQYAKSIPNTIVLVDGEALAQYMIEHNVGVTTAHTYIIKKVDTDYFVED